MSWAGGMRPLGIAFRSSHGAREVRAPRAGEARVSIFNETGALLQVKVGLLLENGARCEVLFEGRYHETEWTDGGWRFVIRRETAEEDAWEP